MAKTLLKTLASKRDWANGEHTTLLKTNLRQLTRNCTELIRLSYTQGQGVQKRFFV
jgi:hypothetical protein